MAAAALDGAAGAAAVVDRPGPRNAPSFALTRVARADVDDVLVPRRRGAGTYGPFAAPRDLYFTNSTGPAQHDRGMWTPASSARSISVGCFRPIATASMGALTSIRRHKRTVGFVVVDMALAAAAKTMLYALITKRCALRQ